ncbi:hypothetical protein AC1031_016750 [Aphanomyces cochlioides]|nr:hypothetical protein AC1031_016750 [Aphanomyces cochlioides]
MRATPSGWLCAMFTAGSLLIPHPRFAFRSPQRSTRLLCDGGTLNGTNWTCLKTTSIGFVLGTIPDCRQITRDAKKSVPSMTTFTTRDIIVVFTTMSGKGKGRARAQDKGKGKAKVPAQEKGKRKAKVPLEVDETTRLLNMTAVVIRQKHSRDTAKQLDATNEQLLQVMRKQVELLEEELLRRKQETDPYNLALVLAKAEILDFEERNKALRSMLENREKLKGWLAAWVDTYVIHKVSWSNQ